MIRWGNKGNFFIFWIFEPTILKFAELTFLFQDELIKTEDGPHAYSNIKWDSSLRRSKILPSVPQSNGSECIPPLPQCTGCRPSLIRACDLGCKTLLIKRSGNSTNHPMTEECSSTATVNIPILDFESRFECGNLRKAIQVCPYHVYISCTESWATI